MALVLFALLIFLAIWLARPDGSAETAASQLVFERAEVTAVLSDNAVADHENGEGRRVGSQELEIKLLTGEHKDEVLTFTNYMSALFNVDVRAGDKVIVRLITNEDGSYYASMFNYDRGLIIGIALLIFCVVLALLGGWKGVRALLGLIFTLGCVWFILIPGLIQGWPGIWLTIGVCAVTTAACLILLNGFTRKTFCAVLGCVGGSGGSRAVRGNRGGHNTAQRLQHVRGREPDAVRGGQGAENQRPAGLRRADCSPRRGHGHVNEHSKRDVGAP